MKVLFDIDVMLDVLLAREPWAEDSALLLAAAERKTITGYIAGHTITTAYYTVTKSVGPGKAAVAVTDLLRILEVVPVEAADFAQALVLGMADFEDAVQAAAAAKVGAEFIGTRNGKHFKRSPVKAKSPSELLALLT